MRACTTSSCPLPLARWSAVSPSALVRSSRASAERSSLTSSRWPFCAAPISANSPEGIVELSGRAVVPNHVALTLVPALSSVLTTSTLPFNAAWVMACARVTSALARMSGSMTWAWLLLAAASWRRKRGHVSSMSDGGGCQMAARPSGSGALRQRRQQWQQQRQQASTVHAYELHVLSLSHQRRGRMLRVGGADEVDRCARLQQYPHGGEGHGRREMRGDAGRCGEMRGDAGRCGEITPAAVSARPARTRSGRRDRVRSHRRRPGDPHDCPSP